MNNFFEKYHPFIFWAGVRTLDFMPDSLKLRLDEGVYRTDRERAEKLLEKLSRRYHLLLTANTSRKDRCRDHRILSDAGWRLIPPGAMYIPGGMLSAWGCPDIFSLYGYPRESKTPPAIPPELRNATPAQRRFMAYYFRAVAAARFGLDY